MKFLNYTIPTLASLFFLFAVEGFLKNPWQVYWLAPFILVVFILSLWLLTGRKIKKINFWHLIITLVLFSAGGLFFLAFLEGQLLKQLFVTGLTISIWVFLKTLFLKFHQKSKYQLYSLENISINLNLLTIFFITSSFFSLIIFLGVSFWFLLVIFSLIVTFLNYQLIWVGGVKLKVGWPYILIITIALIEIFWAISFLPTSVYVNGIIMTVSYYLMSGLARNWLLGIREKRVIKRYLLISIIVLIIILLTAKWV